ncbi:hypothetical protein HY383_01365 [Candidatus Daviesbacteria bacterium]|nr:hypothetical protein [Candidatus Daviesbacteria bacterium]
MGPSKERLNPLINLTDNQLREDWEQADNKPGENVEIRGIGVVTKGQFYLELVRRSEIKAISHILAPSRLRHRLRGKFPPPHPIDGSSAMELLNRVGIRRVMSRR